MDWEGDFGAPATVPRPIVTRLQVAGVRIFLQKTDIKQVQRQLGGTIGSIRGSAVGPDWLCYTGSDTREKWVLWLESSDIDAGTVGSFQWHQLDASTNIDPRCKKLSNGLDHISVGTINLSLGMTEQRLQQILGKPSQVRGNNLIFEHEHEVTDIKNGPFTFSNTVIFLIADGKVTAMDISVTEVN
jgi:hypothetical protein